MVVLPNPVSVIVKFDIVSVVIVTFGSFVPVVVVFVPVKYNCVGKISQFLPRKPDGHSHLKEPSSSVIDVHLAPFRHTLSFVSQ